MIDNCCDPPDPGELDEQLAGPRHVEGPTATASGLLVGVIELLGGLPPEDPEPGDDR